ncbi:1-deoxy-D-xylulose-5-phosphate synthase [Massilia phyllosphaerae]|uniref:1-deoxy-D-xylulose-5-phosphate synthase n=1 Tax=Massilia phyllosphaerae TaxID=3106034 RepID=UPI002B1CB226|nr:1-deoxy-D-xylulose-5-phosphate synthase [Massilia sp. SGZ-792]
MNLLETRDSPADLRRLPRARLAPLARELRGFLLDSVARSGDHLSSNLGSVELTIALHYVFDTPRDRIVWDVDHQCYAHKVLTGRRDRMHTLRQLGGLSGFPRRDESAYDSFGTAHSSTSISAALGMAEAACLRCADRHAVAVCGDGAMSAGLAFEALNNAGHRHDLRLLVVLNDNGMSISPSVGGLDRWCARRRGPAPSAAASASVFEQLGLRYSGPIDGHDLDALAAALQDLRGRRGPQLLHVLTRKGRGYAPAEAAPTLYHGVGRFDPARGLPAPAASASLPASMLARSRPTYTEVFGDWLCDMGACDARLVGITSAMCEGSGMVRFQQMFPARYVDAGIAEQHAVTFAAGLAAEGLKPVVAIYSTFLQRAYDQLIHDVALQNLDVTFAIDRAGLVGPDGATHAGSFDIAFLRCVPNMVLMAASNEAECRRMLSTAYRHRGPAAVRYPRGSGPGVAVSPDLDTIPIGRGELQLSGADTAILAFGTPLAASLEAGAELGATVANMRFIKPLDVDLVVRLACTHARLVTVEEGAVMGGASAAVAEALAAAGIARPLLTLGLPDRFIEHGDTAALLAAAGLDAAGIAAAIRRRFALDTPLLAAGGA